MKGYKPTIGIEIHAELNTKSKMFCGCSNNPHHHEPNTNICPVCLAHPGTLPVVNKEAIRKVLLLGEAVNGEIADFSEFDRKQYFYPDIPKAYQLSQYAYPFVKGGELAGVALTRVHLEEDTAKSQHINANGSGTNANSLVDFNRAGVPLMELVTEPVIHSSKEAANFARELQLTLRTLGISNANMEKGEMRVEANISISADDKLVTKVEVKNLNSFRSMELAIEYEISRQSEMLANNVPIKQETLGWDEVRSRTFTQRSKETAEDYRYFPDPDIPKFQLSRLEDFSSRVLTTALPRLPEESRSILRDIGLTSDQIEVLVYDAELLNFFERAVSEHSGGDSRKIEKLAANYLISDINGMRQISERNKLDSSNARNFIELIKMLEAGEVSSRVAKDLLEEVVFQGAEPKKLAEDRGLLQQSSSESLGAVVEQILAENPSVVAEYQGGKETALQFLVGQGMKLTKGSANPGILAKMLKEAMDK